jgi:hypothetical protein
LELGISLGVQRIEINLALLERWFAATTIAEHAKTIHKMNKIPLDVLDKARSAIRNEGKARAQKAGS